MILSYDDAVEAGTPTLDFGPSIDIGAIGNWLDSRLAMQGGWSNLNDEFQIAVDWVEQRKIGCVALLDYRTPEGATEWPVAEITLYDDSSPVHISPGDAIKLLPASAAEHFVRHSIYVLPAEVTATRMDIVCSTPPTISYGQVSWGRVWAGRAWRPPDGMHRRWETGIVDPGEMGVSRGGQGYPRLRQRRRRLSVALSHMPYAAAFGIGGFDTHDLHEVLFAVGNSSHVICLPRTVTAAGAADTHAIYRLGIYGHLTESPAIRHVAGDRFEADLRVDELL